MSLGLGVKAVGWAKNVDDQATLGARDFLVQIEVVIPVQVELPVALKDRDRASSP